MIPVNRAIKKAREAMRRQETHVVALCIASLIVIALMSVQLLLFEHGRDHGVFDTVATMMAAGGTLYKDVWDLKPPNIYIVFYLAETLFGDNTTAIRILELIFLLSLYVPFSRVTRKTIGADWPALVALALLLTVHVVMRFWNTAQAELFGGVVAAWAIAFTPFDADALFHPRLSWRFLLRIFWVSIGFTVAAFFKPPLGGAIIPAWLLVIYRYAKSVSAQSHVSNAKIALSMVTISLVFLCGVVLVTGVTVLSLILSDAWTACLDIFTNFVPHYTGIDFSVEKLPDLFWVQAPRAFPGHATPVICVGCILLICLNDWRRKQNGFLILMLSATALQLLGIALQAKFFPYHYSGVLILGSLMATMGFFLLLTHSSQKMLTISIFTLLVFFPAWPDAMERMIRRYTILTSGENSATVSHELHNVPMAVENSVANHAVGEWIENNTAPEDRIYVWGFEAVIYDIANRLPASRYIYNVPQRAEWSMARARAELMVELKKNEPAVIVVARNDVFFKSTQNNLDSAAVLTGFTELRAFMLEKYVRVSASEDYLIYQRRR